MFTDEMRSLLVKDYDKIVFSVERKALVGDQNALCEIISLQRVLRAALKRLEERRHEDRTIEAGAADDIFGELHEYLNMRFGDFNDN